MTDHPTPSSFDRGKPPPRVVIFAGPNGAGKSTHADAILAALGIETFVNADYIARGLSGRNTEAVAFEAGRIMLKRLRQLSEAGADFAFESTLSSRTFAPFLRLSNFLTLYQPLADEWTLFDNSTSPLAKTIAAKLNNQLTVMETATWKKLQKLSKVV
jgi:predicted ABC-type ATPase